MNTQPIRILLSCLVAMSSAGAMAAGERWYDDSHVKAGKSVYENNCLECHQSAGAGAANWQSAGDDGRYPPPPLNGTGHTWHHRFGVLKRTIREGGEKLGGVMPPFAGKLDDADVAAVIAYVQSLWPDNIYNAWATSYPEDAAEGLAAAAAVPDSDDQPPANTAITARLAGLLAGGADIGTPEETPIDGVYGVRTGSRYVYLDASGRFLLTGELMDLQTGENLTEVRLGSLRLAQLAGFDESDMAIFPARGEEKSHLDVFTDTTCPYCRKLHSEVPDLQAAGVTVRYLPFPRSGLEGPGYDEMRSVWCADDRPAALTAAKAGDDYQIGDTTCDAADAVDAGYRLGVDVGVQGTPAIVLPDGRMIPGYQPFQNLLTALGVK